MLYGAGILAAAGSLVLHAVYGMMMIGLYENRETLSYGAGQSSHSSRREVPRTQYRDAVTGIIYGTAIGATIAAGLWFLLQDSLAVPGLPFEFTFMAMTFFFSAMGLLIGFWTGAPVRRNEAANITS